MEDQNSGKLPTEAEVLVLRKQEFQKMLLNNEQKIVSSLPKGLVASKLIQVFLNSCTRNPKLLRCTNNSILGAVLTCAQFGLIPDGITGECYIIPYDNRKKIPGKQWKEWPVVTEAQFMIGYKGIIQLAMRSGQVKRFQSRAVYKGDEFDYELGTSEFIKHKPLGKSQDITHVYAILEFKNGGQVFDVMTVDEVNFYRDKSPSYSGTDNKQGTVWGQYYTAMAMKTVIRRLGKYAPISPEFQTAIELDEVFELLGKSQRNDTKLLDYENVPIDDEIKMIEDGLTDTEAQNYLSANKDQTAKDKADKIVQKTEAMLKK